MGCVELVVLYLVVRVGILLVVPYEEEGRNFWRGGV